MYDCTTVASWRGGWPLAVRSLLGVRRRYLLRLDAAGQLPLPEGHVLLYPPRAVAV